MDTVQVLTQVRGFLSDPLNWNKGSMECGRRKCLVAAIFDVIGRDETHPVFEALQKGNHYTSNCPTSVHIVAGLNDRCTHKEMLAWVDTTIAAEKAKRGVKAIKDGIKNIPITEAVEPETKVLVH